MESGEGRVVLPSVSAGGNEMRYMGGKFRQSKALLATISRVDGVPKFYAEPFCGAMGSAEKLVPHFGAMGCDIWLSDASMPLVTMWNAALQGWEPPIYVDDDLYGKYASRRHDPDATDPMTAWCGYALSFGGKWFGGLARQSRDDHAGNKRAQLNQQLALARKVAVIRPYVRGVICCDYKSVELPDRSVFYLDPPYADRTKAHHTAGGFSHPSFWAHAAHLAEKHDVFVTEFTAPPGWKKIHSWGDTVVRHGKGFESDGTDEAIYVRDK